jgi:hypothetical protein
VGASASGISQRPGSGNFEVPVVFRGCAARVVTERRWHSSQEIAAEDGEEGDIELSLRMRGLEEVARRILS